MSARSVTFLHGWFDEEHDGVRPFRWMGRKAGIAVVVGPVSGYAWLRVTAGHGWPADSAPALTVSVHGRVAGTRRIRGPFREYLFPVGAAGELDVDLELERTFTAAGDTRDLGVMVRAIEVVDLDRGPATVDADGWYPWERHTYFPFRWMGAEARLSVPSDVCGRGRFAALPILAESNNGWQTLTVLAGETALARFDLFRGWHIYEFAIPTDERPSHDCALELTLRATRLLPNDCEEDDDRVRSVGVGALDVHDDARRHQKVRIFHEWAFDGLGSSVARPPSEYGAVELRAAQPTDGSEAFQAWGGSGWHGWEFQDPIPFQWMKREGRITVPRGIVGQRRFCVVPIYSEYRNLTQVLAISSNGRLLVERPLAHTWNYYSFALAGTEAAPAGTAIDLVIRANKVIPPAHHPADPRELAVRVGPLTFHDDQRRHERACFYLDNAVRNTREMEAGATVLSSFPVNLGIDIYGKCNIKPPCVYCLWDFNKQFEGDDVHAVVDDGVLDGYESFFDAARLLVNCSFGEPLLHPRLTEILDLFARNNKVAEISTNGQAFTPATIRALAGRSVLLYVSLDAACAETYARLRNDQWHDAIAGLTFLREARRRANRLPKVNLVFMPMRANRSDLEAFFRLCLMVEADALMLRPLNFLEYGNIVQDRGGYHFDYSQEWLSHDEIREVNLCCAEYADKYGVTVHNQFEFGMAKPAAERKRSRNQS